MIELKNISKRYNERTVVDDMSFSINEGDIVGLLGPNGAGKTTTMRILTGYLIADEGEILIDGKIVDENDSKIRSMIGYMPENNPLYKDMLVHEFLSFSLKISGVEKEKHKERIDYVVGAVSIEDKYYRPISELSKGYKQRVGVAAALIHDPKILILDEPTEGLDPNQRNEIRNLITSIGKERTVVISTHVLPEVEAMCNKIIIISDGKKVADGTKEEILAMTSGKGIVKAEIGGKDIDMNLKKNKLFKIIKSDAKKIRTFVEFEVENKKSEDFFKELSTMIATNKWTIYKLESQNDSLENIFKNLTVAKSEKAQNT